MKVLSLSDVDQKHSGNLRDVCVLGEKMFSSGLKSMVGYS